MAERELKKRSTTSRQQETLEDAAPPSDSGEKLKAELDELLDEIDDVLEDNPEEFVRHYVQKGGE
jgi:ubiquitin-like protein Pup